MYQPVILLGAGARGAERIVKFLLGLNIPVMTTWMACDLIAEDHPCFAGRPGILGQRAANIITQKATHLYCIGARMDPEQVAYNYDNFAPNAEIVVFDVDKAELTKYPESWTATVHVDLKQATSINIERGSDEWLVECKTLYAKYRHELDGGIALDPFSFLTRLGASCGNKDVFAIGSSGSAPCSFFQAWKVKAGQRISNVSTIGAMGADIPMALGAALATARRTICLTGDGGFQLNTQELETIHRLRLPITFYVFNNNGYGSIRNMQKARFDGRLVGCDPSSGLTLPNLEEIAAAYGLFFSRMYTLDDFTAPANYPTIVEVMIDPDWQQLPRVMASMKDGVYSVDDFADMTPKVEL